MTLIPELRAELHRAAARPAVDQTPSWHQRWLHRLVPVVSAVATMSIVAVVVIAGGADRTGQHAHPAPPNSVSAARVPSPNSLLPARGGMRGLLLAVGVTGSGSTLHVSLVQCTNCGNTTPPNAREVNWSSTSTDGGHHWQTRRDPVWIMSAGLALPEGPDVWESGYGPHAGDPSFYVSHDSGHTYHPVQATGGSGFEPVTLGDGAAWTLGVQCVHYRCRSSVLIGQAARSRLSPTATQPPGMPTRRAPTTLLVSGDGERGYVSEGGQRRFYVTDNAGQSWTPASYPCSPGTTVGDLTSTVDDAVWVTCEPVLQPETHPANQPSGQHPNLPAIVRRSDDDGGHWQTLDPSFRGIGGLVAASRQTAWVTDQTGGLHRTANGGRSWQKILSGAGAAPALDIENSTTATVVATATAGTPAAHDRRTELIAYRTIDGGAHWSHTLIRLPKG
jgi:hypothetical protein